VITPVEDPELQERLRENFDTLLSDEYSIWQMNADGSYTRLPGKNEENPSSQQAMIDLAQDRDRESKRLKRRKAQSARSRNIHQR